MLDDLFSNYYSLLIPIINIVFSFFVYLIYLNYKKFQSLLWVSLAITFSAFGLLSFSLAIFIKNNFWVFAGYFLFLIVTIFVTKAIYIRFKVKINQLYIACITTIGTVALYYYTYIKDNLDIRVSIWTLTVAFICFHRVRKIIKSKTVLNSDTSLKIIFFTIPTIALILSIFTDSPYNHPDPKNGLITLAWLEMVVMLLGLSIFLLITSTTLNENLNQLHSERNTDTLTGILNRRAFLEKLDEISKHPTSQDYSLVIFDIDHFKRINDQYGHQTGDCALQHIAYLISKTIRSSDVFARIGGEEFIILLPNLTHQNAFNVVERFRSLIENTPFITHNNEPIHITASFGITQFNHTKSLKQAYIEADQMLYQAKTLGRNNIQSI